ncbi:hypothetical protein [Priestia megaterium]|uniref:hypothetical protein n=1 Tax=Priestia megaterium TaxID=1404 RepID=UPI003CC5F514
MNQVVNVEQKERKKASRIGEVGVNTLGSVMEIIEYRSAKEVVVRFKESKYETTASYNQFRIGKVKCPYDKSIYGRAYLGEGDYKVRDENGKITIAYRYWYSMLKRCYSNNFHNRKQKTYVGCRVADEWLCFQTFGKWFDENYYTIDGERTELDKDLIIPNNKLYSPDTVVFAPKRINLLIGKKTKNKGQYACGVKYNTATGKYGVQMSRTINGEQKVVLYGCGYKTEEEAAMIYKKVKEAYIKEVAEEYRGNIPQVLYNALLNYKITF